MFIHKKIARHSRSTRTVARALFFLGMMICILLVPGVARAEANIVHPEVPDLELVNQNGEGGRLLSDFIADKLVAITLTFTSCQTICPVLDSIFLQVQSKMPGYTEMGIELLSISIDPAIDIPPRLKAHAEEIGAQPGWTFLTGEQKKVARILKALEVYTPDIANHPPAIFVVDGRRGVWARLNGFPSADLVVETIQDFQTARAVSE